MEPGKLALATLLATVVGPTIWSLATGMPSDCRVPTRPAALVGRDIPRDLIHERGTRLPDGRLTSENAVEFEDGGGIVQRCYFDASVGLRTAGCGGSWRAMRRAA
ncbi:MAG: hypothetical protein WEE64_05895 [Dehalococcoidia bacterium]